MAKKRIYDDKWYTSIRILYNDGKTSQAQAELEEYRKRYEDDYRAMFLQGQIYYRNREYEDAERLFEIAINSDKAIEERGLIELAKVKRDTGKEDEAEKIFKKIIEKSGEKKDPYVMVLLVDLYFSQEKYEEALDFLRDNPFNANIYNIFLAKIFIHLNNNKEAMKYLLRVDNTTEERTSLINLASIYYRLNMEDKALECIDKLSGVKDIKYYDSLYIKAQIYNKMGEYDQAISICYEGLESRKNSYNKDFYNQLGYAFAHKASYKKAKEYYNIALTSPRNTVKKEALLNLGLLEVLKNNKEEAKIYFEALDEQNDGIQESYENLFYIAMKEHNYEEAEKIYDEYREICMDGDSYMTKRVMQIVLAKALNKPILLKAISYKEKQLISYSEEYARKHIKEHREENVPFNENIDIDKLFDETKEKLTEENLCIGNNMDIYVIDYPNIAPNADSYTVVTATNTKNIITMYPSTKGKYLRQIDFQREEELERKKEEEIKNKIYSKFKKYNWGDNNGK